MKACVLNKINDITLKNIEKPKINNNEVLVKIKACGICSSDIDRVKKSGAYHYPLVLGHEISGQIVEVADNDKISLIGKKVVIFPLIPCKICDCCKNGDFAQCKSYDYFGSRRNGGFAEFLSVPLWNIKIVDNEIPFEVAALTEPAAVAYHAFSKISELNNKNIIIFGTGIIGILTGYWAKLCGHNITFITKNEKKKQILNDMGFKNFISEVQENNFDISFECVGSNESITNAIRSVKQKGSVIVVGNPKEDVLLNKNIYWKILRQELNIIGVWNSRYPLDWDYVLNNIKSIPVNELITHRFKLSDVQNAFNTLSNSQEFKIKGVFIVD